MVSVLRNRPYFTVFLLLLATVIALPIRAQESASSSQSSSVKAASADTPVVWTAIVQPKSTKPEELRDFIVEVAKRQPSTREQYVEMQTAIKSAAEAGLKSVSDRNSDLGKELENHLLNSTVLLMANSGKDAQQATMDRFVKYLRDKATPDANDLKMALLAGQNLEQLDDREFAKKGYRELISVLESKSNEDYATWVEMLKGSLQRLESLGKILELKAKTLDGKDFDLSSLKGKYVLLYFWATWDRATDVEYPYMQKVYDLYHNRGFEVVAISFDTDRQKLTSFLESEKVPWTVLWEPDDRWQQKMMAKYGISAIPTPILIDKDGKVVHLEARGTVLGKLLSEVFPTEPAKAFAK